MTLAVPVMHSSYDKVKRTQIFTINYRLPCSKSEIKGKEGNVLFKKEKKETNKEGNVLFKKEKKEGRKEMFYLRKKRKI